MEPRVWSVLGFADSVASWTHLIGSVAVTLGAFWLLPRARRAGAGWAAGLYLLGAFSMFTSSGVYHLLDRGAARDVLQEIDRAAIWLQIAGSFTVPHAVLLRRGWRYPFLATLWTLCIGALVVRLTAADLLSYRAWIGMYAGLASLGFLSTWRLKQRHGWSLTRGILMGLGWYGVGAVLEATDALVLYPHVLEAHELFHVCVLIGALVHWRFIYVDVLGHAGHPRDAARG